MRLFAFGCSFTKYCWPTWADIMAVDLGVEYYNLGIAGLGNVGIMSRMIEADLKFKFKPEDRIIVLWSGFEREDRVNTFGEWDNFGSIFHAQRGKRDWHAKNWNLGNDIVRNATAIAAANKMYGNQILWQAHSFDPVHAEHDLKEIPLNDNEYNVAMGFVKLYEPYITNIPTCLWDDYTKAFGNLNDIHPDIKQHYRLLLEHVYKPLDLKVNESTKNLFMRLQQDITDKCKRENIKDNQQIQHWIHNYINDEPQYKKVAEVFKHYSLSDDIH